MGALRPGVTLGRYELLVPVGVGGMACVWAARLSGYRGFSKLVAVKTVLPHLASHYDFENMLLDEARIAADAHHPNVCNLFDVGEERGVLYLVLEWVEGDSLLQILRGARTSLSPALDFRIAARIVADGCAGLHAAHELVGEHGVSRGVVHRDVSPHNLLVAVDGTTKIADFGVAKAQGQLHQTTRTGEIRGKLAYMAPEQMSGAGLDRRADIFAMGGVLYHATTGRPPFRGESDARLIHAVLEGSYDPPEQVVADYPPDLATIVTRALSRRADDRFETAEGMQRAIEAWLARQGHVTTASDVGAVVRERIGTRLEQRREEVRAALDGEPKSGSTRPVRPPAMPLDSGTLRATRPPSDSISPPMSFEGSPVRLLPPGPAIQTGDSGSARPPRRAANSLKMAAAVALGLVAAAVILRLRSTAGHTDVDRNRTAAFAASAVVTGAAAPSVGVGPVAPAPMIPLAPSSSFGPPSPPTEATRPANGSLAVAAPSVPASAVSPSPPAPESAASRNAPAPNRASAAPGNGLPLPPNPY